MENRDLKMAEKIAACVADKGGRTFLVGGYVRDLLMGKHSKDIDIEIHGVQPKELENILDGLGSRTEMGASFGVYGLRGYDIDIAMPRQEEATGRGHKDFKIYVDPFLGTYKAAMRRDFTINAMMQDVLTGEIIPKIVRSRSRKTRMKPSKIGNPLPKSQLDFESFSLRPLRYISIFIAL